MDSSHVSLCALLMRAEAFDHFRCDKEVSLGLNTPNLAKLLKCAGNDDIITLKSTDEQADSLTLVFESSKQDRISDFDMRLMQIESEQLGIPDTEYSCTIRLPSSEFQRIMRDLTVLGDTCKFNVIFILFCFLIIVIFENRYNCLLKRRCSILSFR